MKVQKVRSVGRASKFKSLRDSDRMGTLAAKKRGVIRLQHSNNLFDWIKTIGASSPSVGRFQNSLVTTAKN